MFFSMQIQFINCGKNLSKDMVKVMDYWFINYRVSWVRLFKIVFLLFYILINLNVAGMNCWKERYMFCLYVYVENLRNVYVLLLKILLKWIVVLNLFNLWCVWMLIMKMWGIKFLLWIFYLVWIRYIISKLKNRNK